MTNLGSELIKISNDLRDDKVRFALIGGLALAARGVVRATIDIDFLIHGLDKNAAISYFKNRNYRVANQTEEVLQLSGSVQIDILFANRPLSQKMLANASQAMQFPCPVLKTEDLIGLKIQAYKNDASREFQDKADIQALIKNNNNLDWDQVLEYAQLFEEVAVIEDLRQRAGR